MVKSSERIKRTDIIAAALAEVQQDRVKKATKKLKELYAQRDTAKKVVRNVEREIEDYIQELEIDDDDDGSDDQKSAD